jgi:hypothetical protein
MEISTDLFLIYVSTRRTTTVKEMEVAEDRRQMPIFCTPIDQQPEYPSNGPGKCIGW